MSVSNELASEIIRQFPHVPSTEQAKLIDELVDFFVSSTENPLFILKGYAGTGKTTLLSAFVKALHVLKKKSVLLAPTGRAAKVFSMRAGKLATTIHKKIYRKETVAGGGIRLVVPPNLHTNTLFIIDEASMIGALTQQNDGSISPQNLLEDVIEYIYSGKNCRLIFVGDTAQLPPVGSDESPALDQKYLSNYFPKLTISTFKLQHVLRQSSDSDILYNATLLRSAAPGTFPSFIIRGSNGVRRIDGSDLQEELESAFTSSTDGETIVITRSNKRANLFNQQIRSRIFWMEERICGGDKLMIVRNNYFWIDEKTPAGFLANGEMIVVERLRNIESMYGFDFVDARVRLPDYPEMDSIEVKLLLDTIDEEQACLSREKLKELFFAIEQDYSWEKNKRKRYERIMSDPYFNALQVKFAYAITCHKSQGGQWEKVFIDQGFLTEDLLDENFFRWLYTAFTRATEQLYLVNFNSAFFPSEE